jgi:uncharacterized protein (DUF983 family)
MTFTIHQDAALRTRSRKQAMARGFRCRCPNCGVGPLFKSYLKTAHSCSQCAEELHHERAHDAPPYFTMTIVAHIIVPSLLIVEKFWSPNLWLHAAIWLPLTLVLTLGLLPKVKGALIGLQWANRMHGFGGQEDAAE